MQRATARAWAGGAIALVALTGLINLPLPFFGDQALYTVMASMLGDGGGLYTDVWDLKQPGIFAFYLVAGSAFGYTEIGIHTFEIMWWLAFMVVLAVTMRRVLMHPMSVASTIGLIGGTYFLVVSPAELTQVEGLVGLPLFLALWFAYRSESFDTKARQSLMLSGVFGGIALLFKLIFLPIVAVLWSIAVFAHRRSGGLGRAKVVAAVATGLALPIGLAAIVLGLQGSLGEAIWTSLVYPIEVLGVDGIGYGLGFLRENIIWFAVMFLPVHLLALVGLWRAIRGEWPRFDVYAVAWLVMGGIMILAQVSSWFSWHFLLLLVPLGLLAGRGVDWIITTWPERTNRIRVAIALAAVAALLPPLYGGAVKAVPLASNAFALSDPDRRAYELEVWPLYEDIRIDGAILDDPSSPRGPIYVFGDPTYNFLFDRDQAIPVHGWTPQLLTEGLWNRVSDDLVAERPPFVYIVDWAEELVETRGPRISALLGSDYDVVQRSEFGTWFVLARE